ncbi:MAG: hypothetical protein AAGK21_18130, partial [Bacteroidota bacterium]
MLRLAVVSLLLAASASAQGTVGVTGGLHVAWWDSDEDLAESPRLRLVGGLTGRYAPGPIGVQAEVLYAQKGSQLDDGSVRWRADYVEVPVLVAVRGPA